MDCRCRTTVYSTNQATGIALDSAFGESKFERVLGAVPVLAVRDDGADWMRRLRDAALMDENGIALDGALKTIATLLSD